MRIKKINALTSSISTGNLLYKVFNAMVQRFNSRKIQSKILS
jgi:hypothetical protein